ncbi:MAG TPA: BatA and WFA domain-containing protein [Blastocatellia bacterium]|nr:BatA and WFA domain-containing protein [Blastocatellia bacterium]
MFANPLALVALCLLALPILVHMLTRLSGPRVLFPTIRFLRPDESHSLKVKKIKRPLLLILRLAAMGLLILAISGPALIETKRPRAVVLLLDSSLSMNSEAVKDMAASRAREAVSSLAAEDVAAIARFDDSVELLCDFTKDRAALENAIASYSPRYSEADFGEALRWAGEKLATEARSRELILVSDLQATNVNSLKPIRLDGVGLKVLRVNNERRANARIDRVAVRAAGETIEADSTAIVDDGKSALIQPISIRLSLPVMNASAGASNAMLSAVKIGDDLVAGGVTSNRADDFDADDARFFVARMAGEAKVMIVQPRSASTDQATFIERAMRSNAPVSSSRAPAERSEALPDALSNIRAIIAPVEALSKSNASAAREHARKGGSLILSVDAQTNVSRTTEKLINLDERFASLALDSMASTDTLSLMLPVERFDSRAGDEPLFDAKSAPLFASVRFRRASSVHLDEGETLLKYSNNEPAAVRLSVGAGQVVLLGFGLSDEDSTLTRSPAFPAFIEWLTGNTGPGERVANLTIGRTSASLLTMGLTGLTRVYSRNGQVRNEAVSDYRTALGEPGVYEAEDSRGRIAFALNTPAVESSLAQSSEQELLERITISELEPSMTDSSRAVTSEKSGLWRTIAMGALAVSLIELVSSARRRRRSREM